MLTPSMGNCGTPPNDDGAETRVELRDVDAELADLAAAVDEKVEQLLRGGPNAQGAVKALLRQLEAIEPMDAPGTMSRLNADLRTGEEGQEGLAAFLEKREPRWRR